MLLWSTLVDQSELVSEPYEEDTGDGTLPKHLAGCDGVGAVQADPGF